MEKWFGFIFALQLSLQWLSSTPLSAGAMAAVVAKEANGGGGGTGKDNDLLVIGKVAGKAGAGFACFLSGLSFAALASTVGEDYVGERYNSLTNTFA